MFFGKLEVKVGADPEVFIKQGDDFKSAHGLVKGDKANPHPVKDGSVQVDGMALEFNIDPANNVQEFVGNIESVFSQLREQVPPDFEFSDKCTATFNQEYFDSRSDDEKILGCEADYNAYTMEENIKPDQTKAIRTAGGHVHIGWQDFGLFDEQHIERCTRVVKACDYFLGLPSLIYDKDTERRKMYGAAGCFRPKHYGVEYRTLSNAWICTKERTKHIYHNLEQMFKCEDQWDDMFATDIQEILNNSDTDAALDVMNNFGIPYIQE